MQTAMDRQQSKVERFLKLGYSHADIMRVLDSLRHDAQTNDILEELIKTCHKSTGPSQTYTSANGHTRANGLPSGSTKTSRSSSSSPQLVARGCSPPRTVSPARSPTPVDRNHANNFRPVVIDGSNVAMSHGNKQVFSCRGVQLAVKWFWDRGMRDITVFVPLWRKEQPRPETPITDQQILTELERKKILVFTPSRCVNGKRIVCYDDRYIVNLAYESEGIIVSNDNYRDLQIEKPQWKKFIEERLLMYTFANDTFMPPEDPLGRNGPTLDNFLRKRPTAPENKQQPCPYGKKCTYGLKCKYYHPERADQSQLSVADELRAKSKSAIEQEQALHQATITAASTFHPYTSALSDTGLGYSCSSYFPGMVPCVPQEGRGSPVLRSSSPRSGGSPVHPCNSLSPYVGHSTDSDPGFSSLERPLSSLRIQDSLPPHYQLPDRPQQGCSLAFSSGVASSSHTSRDLYSGGPRVSAEISDHFDHPHNASLGLQAPNCCYSPMMPCGAHVCRDSHFPRSSHLYASPHDLGHMAALPHARYDTHLYGTVHLSLEDVHRQRLGFGPWSLDAFDEKRQEIREQLRSNFPPNTVDEVMSRHPRVLDKAQLVALIQKFRTSY